MSAGVLDAPAQSAPGGLFAGGRRATLEELLEGTWRSVRSEGEAECPVCHAGMELADGLGRCSGCGTTLS